MTELEEGITEKAGGERIECLWCYETPVLLCSFSHITEGWETDLGSHSFQACFFQLLSPYSCISQSNSSLGFFFASSAILLFTTFWQPQLERTISTTWFHHATFYSRARKFGLRMTQETLGSIPSTKNQEVTAPGALRLWLARWDPLDLCIQSLDWHLLPQSWFFWQKRHYGSLKEDRKDPIVKKKNPWVI